MEEEKAYKKMANLCARREYSVFDIKNKLFRYKLDTDLVDKIIQKLKDEGFINERRFAKSFIHDKIQFNRWGKIKIEFALQQKMIPKEIMEEAFSQFSEEILIESLESLLEAKWKTIKAKTDYEKRNKLIRFGLSRGFEMNDILQYIDKLE